MDRRRIHDQHHLIRIKKVSEGPFHAFVCFRLCRVGLIHRLRGRVREAAGGGGAATAEERHDPQKHLQSTHLGSICIFACPTYHRCGVHCSSGGGGTVVKLIDVVSTAVARIRSLVETRGFGTHSRT